MADSHIEPFILTRTFNASRDIVWKAFTDPEYMQHWWGPKDVTVVKAEMDLRPGGTFHYCMRNPDGSDTWGKFVFKEITPPERLVLIDAFSDPDGALTRHPMSPTWPLEMLTTFTFEETEGKTKLTIKWDPIKASGEELKTFDESRSSMNQGWGGCLDRLDGYLATLLIPQ